MIPHGRPYIREAPGVIEQRGELFRTLVFQRYMCLVGDTITSTYPGVLTVPQRAVPGYQGPRYYVGS